ncbi:unnamed protein product [Cyprideis torosa]|uniref:Uncharacterized protein n=1 Tax=Cyprideis torosa TaxID=163714 RepID=A0A7R8W5T7_9CRUS|nr:unnamed protein product [Cyprideis torosa]CAG0881220.1 unnamed protein product [Cyprideis torosa]
MKEASRLAGSGFQSGRGSGTVTPDRAHSPTARYAIPQRAMNSSGASGRNSPTFSSPRGSPANGQSATSPTKDGVSLSRILGANKDPTKPPFFLHKKQPSPSNVPPWVVTRNDNFSRSPTRETGLTMGNANGLAHSVAPTPGSNTTTVLSSNNAKTDSASSGGNSVVSLRKQLAEREVRIKDLEAQCDNFRELLQKRDAQVEALQREVHKLKDEVEV